MYRVGIDIGATKINIGLFHAEKKALIDSAKEYVKNIDDPVSYIKSSIYSLAEKNGASVADVVFVGVGIPGTVSEDGRKIVKAPNIEILSENLAVDLESALNIPVRLIQDSRAAAWGEYLVSDDRHSALVCITLGTGIGTGIVINGEIYRGALGAAGELGHLPIRGGSRPCGCGKTGCLEKYAAGGGLDITASEILNTGANAKDLFREARLGNKDAKEAISDAVKMLGSGLVSVVNLLSPDVILLSGGLSAERELYVDPLISYIKEHCYTAGKLPKIEVASLGDVSPLYGAAYLNQKRSNDVAKARSVKLSASIMCADVLNFGSALKEIEEAGIDYIHADIMDNHFVPNLMLPPELLNKLHSATKLPFDYHLMTKNPESVIEKLTVREGDIITIHYESTPHIESAVSLIRQKGAKVGLAINPSTPVEMITDVVSKIDMMLVMTVNPGFAGQKLAPGSFEKIERARAFLNAFEREDVVIQVDGNCSFENVPKMRDAGADIFVVGTSSVFHKDMTVKEGVKKLLSVLDNLD